MRRGGGGGGQYAADYRFDEGLRIRDEGECPCIPSHQYREADGCLSGVIFIIEVRELESKKRD